MQHIEQEIEVAVPVSNAYEQWTQFESFPQFMGAITKVQQEDDEHLTWIAEIAGVTREWRAEIVERVPDKKVEWHAIEGAKHRGRVELEELGPARTLVKLRIEYQPDGIIEGLGASLGGVAYRLQNDLENFKDLVERRNVPREAVAGDVPASSPADPEPRGRPTGPKERVPRRDEKG